MCVLLKHRMQIELLLHFKNLHCLSPLSSFPLPVAAFLPTQTVCAATCPRHKYLTNKQNLFRKCRTHLSLSSHCQEHKSRNKKYKALSLTHCMYVAYHIATPQTENAAVFLGKYILQKVQKTLHIQFLHMLK